MSHLDEGTLHAMLDGELEPNDVAEIQAHLASCSSCGLRLREVREFLDEADRLIASVEMNGATAASMRHGAPIEAAPEAAPEAVRGEPVHAERPEPPPRPQPRPVPDRPVAKETWNAPPPPLLMPDNESPADRRMRRVRKYGWAAMIAVFVGAGFIGVRLREPAQAAFDARDARKTADAIVSPEETARPAAPTADSVPTALATRPPLAKGSATPKSPARELAPRDALKEAPKNAGKIAEQGSGKDEGGAGPASEPKAAAAADISAPAEEATEDSSGTEDLATVRSRAAEALAELDRERRRSEAAAATAALDAQRRRRLAAQPAGGAPNVARAAQVAPAPPTPPTLEQRAQVYLRIGLDEASRQLGGPAHVIEGMSAMFIGLAQGVAVPGADATRPVVRVVYQDSQGRLILLDQQRLRAGQATPQGSPLGWVLGEIAIWLHGEVGPDALGTYRPRVR